MKKSAILFGLLLLAPVMYGQEPAESDTTRTAVFEYDDAGNRIARMLVTGQPETDGVDGSEQTTGGNPAAEAKLPDDTDIDEGQINKVAV